MGTRTVSRLALGSRPHPQSTTISLVRCCPVPSILGQPDPSPPLSLSLTPYLVPSYSSIPFSSSTISPFASRRRGFERLRLIDVHHRSSSGLLRHSSLSTSTGTVESRSARQSWPFSHPSPILSPPWLPISLQRLQHRTSRRPFSTTSHHSVDTYGCRSLLEYHLDSIAFSTTSLRRATVHVAFDFFCYRVRSP